MPSSSPPPPQPKLYFAFGSNLHLGQMAKRCPESRYVGIARLLDYRFQINNRRYANLVPSPGSCVEGLVYRLSLTDEASLDRSEGVPTAYEKYMLGIELFTTPIEYVARAVSELATELEANNLRRSAPRERSGYDNSEGLQHHSFATFKGQSTLALVYLSTKHVREGKPWDEYIDRMNLGIIDACKLGLSDRYVKHCLRRYIRDQPLPSQDVTPARRPENHYQRSRESSTTRHSSPERRRRPTLWNFRSRSAGPTIFWGRWGHPRNARTQDTWDNDRGRIVSRF